MRSSSSTEYSTAQFESNYPPGFENHYWGLARNRIIERALRSNGLAQKTILEVGCGLGFVVDYLRRQGLSVWGVELANVKPLSALAPYVKTGTLAESLPADFRSTIEVLMLLDLIEHIPSPSVFLSDVLNAYPAVEHLILTVPARRELWSNYDDYYGHHHRYDLPDVRALLASVGLSPSFAHYFFHGLYLPALALKTLRRKRALSPRVPVRQSITSFHHTLSTFFVWEYRLLPRSLCGTSIIAGATPASA